MKANTIRLCFLGLSASTLIACTSTQVGTTTGAAAGAGVGYAVGGGTGALIGGGAGGLLGYTIGQDQDRKQVKKRNAKARYYYR